MRYGLLSFILGLSFLLSGCYSVAVKDGDLGYIYYQLLSTGKISEVKEFLKDASSSEREDIVSSIHNPYGLGIVALTIHEGYGNLVPLLVEQYNADVDQKGLADVTALQIAVDGKMLPETQMLLEKYKASLSLSPASDNILHVAFKTPKNPVSYYLADKYPGLLAKKNDLGNLPLYYIVRNNDVVTMRKVLRLESPSHVTSKNKEGVSALSYSVDMNYDTITALLKKIR